MKRYLTDIIILLGAAFYVMIAFAITAFCHYIGINSDVYEVLTYMLVLSLIQHKVKHNTGG